MISCFIQWTSQIATLLPFSVVWRLCAQNMTSHLSSPPSFCFEYSRQCPPRGRKSSDKVVSDCWCIRRTCARCFSAKLPTRCRGSGSRGWEKITFVKLHIKWQTCFHAVLSAYSLRQRMNTRRGGDESDFKEQQQKVSRRLAKLSELMQKGKWDLL